MNAYSYIAFSITDKCNTICKYCFKDCSPKNSTFLPFETVKNCIDWCVKKADSKTFVQITGGEPFLHPDIWKILTYARSKGFTLRLQTNGLLLEQMSHEQLSLLAQPGQVFKISLDGYNEETHEEMRAKGTFTRIIRGIEKIKPYKPRYSVKSVLSSRVAADFQKMLELSISIGAAGISYNLLRPEGKAIGLTNPVDELGFTKRAIELFNQERYHYLLNGSRVLEIWMHPQSYIKPKFFYVNCDGFVYPSQDLVPDECIGNANSGAECLIEENLAPQKWEIPLELYELVKQNLQIEGIKPA